MKDKYYDWVKRLGQYHLSIGGQSTTLCGMPMMGNNYAKVIPKDERTKCNKCFNIAEIRSLT